MKLLKLLLVYIILGNSLAISAQFQAISFDFAAHAQSFQLNPGVDYAYQRELGIPLLNNIQLFAGNTGFSLYDLFAPNGSFDDKVYQSVKKLKNTDFLLINNRIDLFSYGYKDDLERFKYFGLYWEFDHFTNIPADLIRLGFEGNAPHLFEKYDAKYLASKTEFIQSIYYGVNKKANRYLSVGYRFKLYSGIANAQSTGNSGTFYTNSGQNNYYVHHLENIDLSAQSSGFNESYSTNNYLQKFLFSGNYGAGIDLGINYRLSEKLQLSASLLDLGFIYYTSDINAYQIKGNYDFEGVNMQFPETGFIDYWEHIKQTFDTEIERGENKKSYISYRPTTVYTSLKYALGDLRHQNCEDFMNLKNAYNSFFGLTGFAQYRPVKVHLGISAFYEQKWSKYFYSKLNYSIDNFSYSSIGLGLVANIGRLQLYVSADNLLGLSDVSKSRKQAIQVGVNLIKF